MSVIQSIVLRPGWSGVLGCLLAAVVAASALLGFMAPPSELGIEWDARRHGI